MTAQRDPSDLTRLVSQKATELGFDAVAFTDPASISQAGDRLGAWLDLNRHGDMTWMAERSHWRADPGTLWPEARSIIMLAETYGPEKDPLEVLNQPRRGAVSCYAKGKDYHDIVKKRLKRLGRWLIEQAGGEVKVFVDTAPVMEKPLAQAAGLGWQGKHTNLVSRQLGSWFFLGAVFTTLDLHAGAPHTDNCGTCRLCLDICPTAAFPAPYQLDARRCISYLTIELKTAIPRDMRPAIGNRIYGCDDCLAVCPWNKFAAQSNAAYAARPETEAPDLSLLAGLDDAGFRARFRGSPIKRIGRDRFVRNVLIAIGNSRDPLFADQVSILTQDTSPLVRGAAVWAFSRLTDRATFEAARRADPDPGVSEEWRMGAEDLARL